MKHLALFFLLLSARLAAQPTANVLQIAPLPFAANESSGLVKTGPNSFWTHNDSGGLTELYEVDSNGTLLRTLQLTNCSNVDWEDISQDAAGNLYIGDFGNNFNFRQVLSIYRIPPPASIAGNTFAVQDTIRFYYPDQTQFPPSVSQWNYDLESMVVFQDSIYLFTKNRTNPSTGYSRLYVIPAQTGLHAAGLRDSVFTGTGTVDNYSITGAALKSDGSRLLLMSNLRLWLLTDFSLPFISQATKQEFIFSSATQKEGVTLDNDSVAWFSDEGVPGQSGYLYRLTGDSLLTSIKEISPQQPEAWPNPFDTVLNVRTKEIAKKLVITDMTGKILISLKPQKLQEAISTEKIKSGVYLLRVDFGQGSRYAKVMKE
jgi:hypothetical protein